MSDTGTMKLDGRTFLDCPHWDPPDKPTEKKGRAAAQAFDRWMQARLAKHRVVVCPVEGCPRWRWDDDPEVASDAQEWSREYVESLPQIRQLPVEIQGATDVELVALGFQFGEVTGLHRQTIIPPGWRIERLEPNHLMWRRIVDETGRERLMVFNKAEKWDPRAFMRVTRGDLP